MFGERGGESARVWIVCGWNGVGWGEKQPSQTARQCKGRMQGNGVGLRAAQAGKE